MKKMKRKNKIILTKFEKRVFDLTKKIPKGKVLTYKMIAQKIGTPGLARTVGNVLGKNRDLQRIPCYRIVKSSGGVGGYAGGTTKKEELLLKDGLKIKDGKIINLETYLASK